MTQFLDWNLFDETGILLLGQVVPDEMIATMQSRIDDIMLGHADVDHSIMLMQLDSTDGSYDSAGPQTKGHKGARLDYRKIEQLEYDRIFREYMEQPVFEAVARRFYGNHAIACFRAMFMNKPAERGTALPMHQDRWSYLDRDPLLTIYTALDDASIQNGCVLYLPGSHHTLLNPAHDSGFLTKEMASEYSEAELIPLELKAGEVAILHNWTLHKSGINHTGDSRRAFSVCLMDADTRVERTGELASESLIFNSVPAAN